MILADSSVWIEALRKNGNKDVKSILAKLIESGNIVTSDPIRLEILGSARRAEREKLDKYFSDLDNIEITSKIWESAISLSRKLRDHGASIPWNDILIATASLSKKIPIYTLDKHFVEMKRVVGISLLFEVK